MDAEEFRRDWNRVAGYCEGAADTQDCLKVLANGIAALLEHVEQIAKDSEVKKGLQRQYLDQVIAGVSGQSEVQHPNRT